MKEIIFVLFALLTVGSALYIAISRNIVYAVFSLLLTLGSVAALYVFLGADFLAGIQLLVYVGGILVLIIFAVMLIQGIEKGKDTNPRRVPVVALIFALILLSSFLYAIWQVDWPTGVNPVNAPSTKAIGNSLLKNYLLPFEAISVLLLIGLIGSVTVARLAHQKGDPKQEQ